MSTKKILFNKGLNGRKTGGIVLVSSKDKSEIRMEGEDAKVNSASKISTEKSA
jgi:hypothetical protein